MSSEVIMNGKKVYDPQSNTYKIVAQDGAVLGEISAKDVEALPLSDLAEIQPMAGEAFNRLRMSLNNAKVIPFTAMDLRLLLTVARQLRRQMEFQPSTASGDLQDINSALAPYGE